MSPNGTAEQTYRRTDGQTRIAAY